ncbi:MAG: SdiA-regulated domain-containing protein [Lentisphaeraceae bacterium]|nr:SdiA-regulated domain-containing protein [Lentisphaeraceae bacterium]
MITHYLLLLLLLTSCSHINNISQAYHLSAKIEIAGITNASGICYSPYSETLFLISNRPAEIYEIDLNGKILQSWKIRGIDDTEDICWIKESTFAICDESENNITEVHMNGKELRIGKQIKVLAYAAHNKGLEGVAFHNDKYYSVREKPPLLIHDTLKKKLGTIKDASALTFWHGELYVLSDESNKILKKEVKEWTSFLHLKKGFNGLVKDIPQAEGLCFLPDGTLYICSEPNLLYIFAKIEANSNYSKPAGN